MTSGGGVELYLSAGINHHSKLKSSTVDEFQVVGAFALVIIADGQAPAYPGLGRQNIPAAAQVDVP